MSKNAIRASELASAVTMVLTPLPSPASGGASIVVMERNDCDGNGLVDFSDIALLVLNFGSSG